MLIKYLVNITVIFLLISPKNSFSRDSFNFSKGTFEFSSQGQKGYLKFKEENHFENMPLVNDLDDNYVPNGIDLLGEVKGIILFIADSYPSRTYSKSGYCGAGNEVYLRVLSIKDKLPKEIYRIKISSCFDSISLDGEDDEQAQSKIGEFYYKKDSLYFDSKSSEFNIIWGYNPKKENISKTILHINKEGDLKVIDKQ